jgi:hypothetical protein
MVELRKQKKLPEEIVEFVEIASSTLAGYPQKLRDHETEEEREATRADMARLQASFVSIRANYWEPPQAPEIREDLI